MSLPAPPTELCPWALEAIEQQIATRGEATHYEPMRREDIAGRSPSTGRLAWFDRCAERAGYRIERSERTGGIVIKPARARATASPREPA